MLPHLVVDFAVDLVLDLDDDDLEEDFFPYVAIKQENICKNP